MPSTPPLLHARNLAAKARKVKVPASDSKAFQEHEIVCYWIASLQLPDPWGQFFRILLLTALHAGELVSALCSDIYLEQRMWNVRGPGRHGVDGAIKRRDRAMPLTDRTQALLRDLAAGREAEDSPLFRSSSGGPMSLASRRMAEKKLRLKMEEACRTHFPDRTVGPWAIYSVRHTAHAWLRRTCGPDLAGLILGWRSHGYSTSVRELAACRAGLAAWEQTVISMVGNHDARSNH